MAYTFNPLSGTFDFYTSGGSGLTIGSTTITSGTSGRVLYDNAGVVGEMTNTGSGTVNVLQNTPTLTTPVLGVATGTSLQMTQLINATSTDGLVLDNTGTATSGNQKISPRVRLTGAVFNTTGSASAVADVILENVPFQGPSTSTSDQYSGVLRVAQQVSGGGYVTLASLKQIYGTSAALYIGQAAPSSSNFTIRSDGSNVILNSATSQAISLYHGDSGYGQFKSTKGVFRETVQLGFGTDINNAPDAFFMRNAAAIIQLGADVNGAAVNQTLAACNGITGTDKTGGNFTINTGKGTGAGAVSSFIVQTPTVLASGTTAQSLATRLTINSAGAVFTGGITLLGGAVLLTTSSALTNGAGASAGTITNAPAVGNPTKWIGINDNGTTRYIPAW